MKSNGKNLLILLSITLSIVILSTILIYTTTDVTYIKNTKDVVTEIRTEIDDKTGSETVIKYDFRFDENICGIRITDLNNDIGKIMKVNYFPDEFKDVSRPMKNGQILNLKEKNYNLSKRGTLQFIILPPDPYSETYKEDILKLERFKRGDYWHFTLQIPPIFDAANIYTDNKCVASYGAIKDYDFIDNSITDIRTTKKHISQTGFTTLNLTYYTDRGALNPNIILPSSIITIHYESSNSLTEPIIATPFFGTDYAVRQHNVLNTQFQIITSAISVIVIFVLLFIALLKKQKSFIPIILSLVGIFLSSFTYVILSGQANMPSFGLIINFIAPIITLVAAIIAAMQEHLDSKTMKTFFIISMVSLGLVMLLDIFSFLISRNTLEILRIIILAVLGLNSGFLLFISYYNVLKKGEKISYMIPPIFISFSILLHLVKQASTILIFDPIYHLLNFTVLIVFLICLKSFIDIERQNVYLTTNLEKEINIQTNELRKVLDDRNTLIQFVSHDLKKPVAFYINNLNILKHSVNEEKSLELIDSLIVKSNEVKDSLNKISEFSRLNFLNEKTIALDLGNLLHDICKSILPDCNASGVRLQVLKLPKKAMVFAKIEGLKQAILNIIFNALEHSECSDITIKVEKIHHEMRIGISNNGKKIDENLKIFEPYVSEFKEGTHGLGLYIVKQSIESMNGTISFESSDEKTTFFITLPIFEH